MRKIAILLVVMLSLVSFVVITIYGLAITSFNETIFVESVEFTNHDYVDDKGTKFILVYDYNEPVTYRLEWRITPANATKQTVSFTTAPLDLEGIELDHELGIVTINIHVKTFDVLVTSTDGSDKKDMVRFRVRTEPKSAIS
jgi:hypothetical protein